MSKHIGIIYSDHHPLLSKIFERLEQYHCRATFIHYQSLAFGPNQSHPLEDFNVVYLDRMGEKDRSYSTQIDLLSYLHSWRPQTAIVNSPKSYSISRNKALMCQALSAHKVNIPSTGVIYQESQIDSFCRNHPSEFYVVKSVLGSSGDDIHILKPLSRPPGIKSILDRDGIAIIQTFILNPGRFIWRIDIVNGDIIVCNQRFAYNSKSQPPICNGTLGGDVHFWKPDQLPCQIRETAINAVQSLGLTVAGVDMIESPDGALYVLEVNPEPDITLDRFEFPFAIANHLRSL